MKGDEYHGGWERISTNVLFTREKRGPAEARVAGSERGDER
jgi:hypothetical protein